MRMQDFTFVCPTEIIAFSDRAEEFLDLNTQLIAASTDTEEVGACSSSDLRRPDQAFLPRAAISTLR